MSWIPGWGDAASAGWWGGFWFWASIVSLVMLGVCEVISHRYSERRDALDAEQRTTTQRQHDSDMAALGVKAAQATERAANAELALEQYKAPRTISDPQATQMRERLQPFAGTHVDIFLTTEWTEVANLNAKVREILSQAGWHAETWAVLSGAAATGTVVVTRNGADNAAAAAWALVTALNAAGVPSNRQDGPVGWQQNWNTPPGFLNGPPWPAENHAAIRLVIGPKN